MTKRISIPKRTRFEVFKRDSFTCQYCGRKAPDILLVIDHLHPVAKGGTNDLLNLVSSCSECNSGKSDRVLSDQTVIEKQRQQSRELQERREQIEMMFLWQEGLHDLEEQVITKLSNFWSEQCPGFSLNKNGLKDLRRLAKKFRIEEVLNGMRLSAEQYIEYTEGKATKESVELAWRKVGGVCTISRREKEQPSEQRLYYIRGILRNRLSYVDDRIALQLLREAFVKQCSIERLEEHAKVVHNWTQWRTEIESFIEHA